MTFPESNSLRSRTVHALSWSFLESVGLKGVQFLIGIVLARLLLPEQFGLIGMLTIFMAVAQSFLDSGFGAALIQKREVTATDTCSIFYFNILAGLTVTGLLWLVAPWIAAFYNQPVLTSLTRALSLTIVINAFGLIQNTILTKGINFKTQTKVSLIAGLLSGIIGVTLAATGFGVWSLAVQQISSTFFRTLFLWLLNAWRPGLVFSLGSLREMFGFGSRLLASAVLNQIFENIYFLVIGKLFSAIELGFFTRARSMQDLPSQTLSGMVGRVVFPVFSAIQDDRARVKRGMKKASRVLALFNFPMMIGLAAIAHPLVLVLLTEKWAGCVPYLQLLCFSSLLFPLHAINLSVLQALGRSDLFLRLEIAKKVLIIINIAVTVRWGIPAMICGITVLSVVFYYLNSYYTGVLIDYPIGQQVRDWFSYLIMAVLMGIAVYAAGSLPFSTYRSMLLAQTAIGIVTYCGLCRLFRLMAFMDVWQVGRAELLFVRPEWQVR